MKIVLGHKNLNLEELLNISLFPLQSEVVIDNQIQAEFSNQPTQAKDLQQYPTVLSNTTLSLEHERAILTIKLVQLIKLKRGATKITLNFLVTFLNTYHQPLSTQQKPFFQALFEYTKDNNIFFNEKELFIMQSEIHIYQALFALESYKLTQRLKLFDTTLAFSLESLNVHSDYFTEYALTLGKSSQGINNFKNSMLSLVDKSKMLSTQPNKDLQDKLKLSQVYSLQSNLHERVLQMNQYLANEINSDLGSLFNEKKYKELLIFAKQQQNDQLSVFSLLIQPLTQIIDKLAILSQERSKLLNDNNSSMIADQLIQEESKQNSIDTIFEVLKSDRLYKCYVNELVTAFQVNKSKEEQLLKQASQEQQQDGDAKKKKKKEQPTTLSFGKGTRHFFDYLLSLQVDIQTKIDVLSNKELDTLLNEVLESRNEERRKPKCAKGTRDMTPLQMAIREKAFATIKAIFKKHGAEEIDTPVFELKETLMGKYGEESKLIYDLEDQGGELLSLRYDLTVPFARYVAERGLSSIKRFHIAKVYRRDNPQMSKGRFREFYQCDFDIAGAYSLMIPDAEVVKVVVDILASLDIGGFVLKINHRKFLDAIVELSGCEKRKFKAICSSVDKLDKEPWSKVKEELITMKGLTEEMTNKLGKFVEYKGKPKELITILKGQNVFTGHKEGEETIKEMELLFDYLEGMSCLDNVVFDFSLARGLDYYTGLIYEAVLTDTDKVGSIAGGGRYDGLVGMFSSKNIPAVGVSIGIERIFSILEEKAKADKSIRSTETQILIAQIGKNLTKERLKICSELWTRGIKAETLYNDNPKTQKQLAFALESGIPLIMWIGEDEVKKGVVKVKSLSTHEEYFIARADMVDKVEELVKSNPILIPQTVEESKGEEEAKIMKD